MFALSALAREPLSVNLKCEPALAEELRDAYPAIRPGWHMNKRHWNTVTLDGSLPDETVLAMIEDSYDLVVAALSAGQARGAGLGAAGLGRLRRGLHLDPIDRATGATSWRSSTQLEPAVRALARSCGTRRSRCPFTCSARACYEIAQAQPRRGPGRHSWPEWDDIP